MHKYIKLCLFISIGILYAACGPRNPYVSQQILGEWFLNNDEIPQLQSIKFNTNKTFDLKINQDDKMKGSWSTIDSSFLNLNIDNFKELHGDWNIEIENKILSLRSVNSKAEFQFRKKK